MIAAADAWLHITTTTVPFVQVSITDATHSFGRGLSSDCINTYMDDPRPGYVWAPCTVGDQGTITGAPEAFKTVNNVSTVNRLITVSESGLQYVFLGDAQASDNIDFVASTVAISTYCVPITRDCNIQYNDRIRARQDTFQSGAIGMPFNCSSAYSGNLEFPNSDPDSNCASGPQTFSLSFFNDPVMTIPAESNQPTNPLYVGISALVSSNGVNTSIPLFQDPDIDTNLPGSIGVILLCNATVYDATYIWSNGSFVEFSDLTLSNTTTAGTLNGQPMISMITGPEDSIAASQFSIGVDLAAFSDTAQGFADKMALVYSQTTVGYSAGVFSPRTNAEEQIRETSLVARVPFAPFYTLIALNVSYAVGAIILAIVALFSKFPRRGVGEVQIRLSVLGVVAHAFKQSPDGQILKSENLFDESRGSSNVVGVQYEANRKNWDFHMW